MEVNGLVASVGQVERGTGSVALQVVERAECHTPPINPNLTPPQVLNSPGKPPSDSQPSRLPEVPRDQAHLSGKEPHSQGLLTTLARRLLSYGKPRPTTGDSSLSSPEAGALVGGIEGYVGGGAVVAASGLLGGYAGVKVGEKTGSFLAGVATGGGVGAGIATLATAALSLALATPFAPIAYVASLILGGFAGASGAMAGSRLSSIRDSVYGGSLAGFVAAAATGNPALVLAGAAGGGIAGRAVKPKGRMLLSLLTGALTGAIAGLPGGPSLMGVSAVVGAISSLVGTVIGPTTRQVSRNMTEDLTDAVSKKVDPWIEKHPLSRGQKILAGSLAGALTLGPLGLLFGPVGLAIAGGTGALLGAVSTFQTLRKREQIAKEQLAKQQLAREQQKELHQATTQPPQQVPLQDPAQQLAQNPAQAPLPHSIAA